MGELVPQAHGGAVNRVAKGEVLNPHGRPKRSLALLLEKMDTAGYGRVSIEDVRDAYERVVNLKPAELKAIEANKEIPILVKIIAKNLLDGKRDFDVLERMLDRAHGKATQGVDLTSKGEKIGGEVPLTPQMKKIQEEYETKMLEELNK